MGELSPAVTGGGGRRSQQRQRSPVDSRGAFGLNSASENGFNSAPVHAPTLAGAFHCEAGQAIEFWLKLDP